MKDIHTFSASAPVPARRCSIKLKKNNNWYMHSWYRWMWNNRHMCQASGLMKKHRPCFLNFTLKDKYWNMFKRHHVKKDIMLKTLLKWLLELIKRNLEHCPQEVKLQAYKSLVRPILEYSLSVWDLYANNHFQARKSTEKNREL